MSNVILRRRRKVTPAVAIAISGLVFSLSGCLVGPNYHRPSAPTPPPAYKGPDPVTDPANQTGTPPAADGGNSGPNAGTSVTNPNASPNPAPAITPSPTTQAPGMPANGTPPQGPESSTTQAVAPQSRDAQLGAVWQQAQPGDTVLRGKWWEMYNDPQLNALEEKVAVSNQTLRAASERYQAAREQIRIARADLFPTFSLGPSASRNQLSLNRAQETALTQSLYNDVALEGQAAWEPDLWGRVRRNIEAARANTQATAADLANTELSIRSELALEYFQLRGLDIQKRLLDDTVISFEKSYDLTLRRFHGGVSSESDVALAETQLQSTRAQDTEVDVARAQYEDAIATLIGESASTFRLPPELPRQILPAVPIGMPSALLERRPDISTAERRVQAANAQIGIQKAAYYPNISINATGGFESTGFGTLVQGPATLWSLGGSGLETIFDFGRRHGLTEQAEHNYEATVADYRQSVLNAFQEVEDNLANLSTLKQEAGSQHAAVAAAQRSLDLSVTRYKGGVTSYLEVLTAQSALLANQRTDAGLGTRELTTSVNLVRALGGGWDTGQLPKF